MTHHCRILSMGAVSALGAGVKRHYEASVEGDQSSLQQFETALSGRRTLVGSVREVGDYPQLPLCFRSRNTNLLLDAAEQIADLRSRLGFSQVVFAKCMNVSAKTVQAWEQGLRVPDGPALRLMDLAGAQPALFKNMIHTTPCRPAGRGLRVRRTLRRRPGAPLKKAA